MRKYINIVETAGFRIPDFKVFVTDALVDKILSTKQWVDHGSYLDDAWIRDMADEDKSFFPFDVDPTDETTIDELIATPNFRAWFKNYLLLRAKHIRETLTGKHGFDPLTGSTRLFRSVMVSKQWMNQVRQPSKGMLPLGIYWGVGEVHSWGYHDDNVVGIKTPFEVVVSTTLNNVTVNWYETFLSRLDYDNGDHEQEIQLEKGSRILDAEIEGPDGSIINHPSVQFIA